MNKTGQISNREDSLAPLLKDLVPLLKDLILRLDALEKSQRRSGNTLQQMYFSTSEAAKITGLRPNTITKKKGKLGIQPRALISLTQLHRMASGKR